jgi:hypothetical protein
MPFRSPSHYWAITLGRPADLLVVATAAAAARSAVDALELDDVELARRYWASIDGDEQLSIW